MPDPERMTPARRAYLEWIDAGAALGSAPRGIGGHWCRRLKWVEWEGVLLDGAATTQSAFEALPWGERRRNPVRNVAGQRLTDAGRKALEQAKRDSSGTT